MPTETEFYVVVVPIYFDGATILSGVAATADLPADHLASWETHHMIVPYTPPEDTAPEE